MAPIKFEEHIKDQLEERRIQPRAAGWERISGQLEVYQGEKKSKRLLWWSIAASFIIGVGLTAVFFQSTNNSGSVVVSSPDQKEVPQNIQEQLDNAPVIENHTDNQDEIVQVDPSIIKPEEKSNKNAAIRNTQTRKQGTNPNQVKQAVAISELPSIRTKETVINEGVSPMQSPSALDLAITQEVTEAVAQVSPQELVTDAEIEGLLRNAQRDIVSEHVLKGTNEIDANALLLDVEAEVDPERFRDKIFRTLKSEFGKAVEAVANKDN